MSSCSGGDTDGTTTGNDSLAGDSMAEDNSDEMQDEQNYLLPSPLQIAYIFKKSGMKYVPGTAHDPNLAANYSSQFTQSIALGLYSSDLAYCVLNKQSNDARNYMKAVKDLSDKLGMAAVFNSDDLMKRFDANIGNEDSIMFILSELQSKSDEFFSSNDRQVTAAEVFSGAWVESMYIASKVSKGKDSKLAEQLADQMAILDNLIKELKKHEASDSNIGGLLAQLQGIHDIIMEIPGVKEMMESDKPEEVKINASDDQLKKLAAKLEEVRTAMTKG
ncbi:MAG: hypothetical protein AB1458_13375 [Bacteroidota bacterium]